MATIETISRTALRVEAVTDDGQLDALSPQWNSLAGGMPLRRAEWLATWWRHYRRRGDELAILAVRDADNQLVGLAPWYVHRSPLWGRELRFLGSGKVYTDYQTILAAKERGYAVVEVVAAWLHERRSTWDSLALDRVDAGDPLVAQLADAMRRRGHLVEHQKCDSCWRVEFPATWEEYIQRLSKSRRERVRQLLRRQFDSGRAVLRRVESEADLPRGMEILAKLHRRRRQSLGQDDCFACSRFRGFLHEVAKRFLADDRLRLQWVELEGRPVAAEIDLAGDDAVYFYQSGMEPDAANERPGWLGTIAALKRDQEDGFRYFDFLGGDESYKSHWRAEERPMLNLRIVPPRALARVRQRVYSIKEQARQWLKARRSRPT